MKKYLFPFMAGCLFVSSAYAEVEIVTPTVNKGQAAKMTPINMMNGAMMPCGQMQENATINISFNIRAQSFADAKAKFDEKIKQVADFAKQQDVKKFDQQSLNYNVNSQNNNFNDGSNQPSYQLSGNAGYQLDSADSAFKLAEFLTQQKFQVNVNVNKFNNHSMPCDNVIMK